MPTRHTSVLIALALGISIFFIWQGMELGRRIIWIGNDSVLTAERSRQMLVSSNPLTVKRNFYADYKKPPLHYWLTAPLLYALPDRMMALLAWPLLFGAASLILTGLLARQLQPSDRWLPLWSMAFLATCSLLIKSASMAYLDTGMVAFLLLTVVAYEASRRHDWAWWLVGAGVGLGFLHKVPLGLIYLGVILSAEYLLSLPSASRNHKHFRRSCWFWSIPVLGWPLSQAFLLGPSFIKRFFGGEVIDRIKVNDNSALAALEAFWQHWLFILPLTAAGLLLFVFLRKKEPFRPLLGIALFVTGYTLFILIIMPRERYLLPATPFLALFAAWFLRQLFSTLRIPLLLPAGLVLILSSSLAWQQRSSYMQMIDPLDRDLHATVLQWETLGINLREIRRPQEPVIVFLKKADTTHFCSGISFFSGQPDSLLFWASRQIQPQLRNKSVRFTGGNAFLLLARPADLALYPGLFPDLAPVETKGEYTFYRGTKALTDEMRQRNN